MLEILKEKLALMNLKLPKNDLVRWPGGNVTMCDLNMKVVACFMRAQLFLTLVSLTIGMEIFFDTVSVALGQILGHGGFFNTEEVGQKTMAAALNAPESAMATAGESSARGMAILAAFVLQKKEEQTQNDYLAQTVFSGNEGSTIRPYQKDVKGFPAFMERYNNGLVIEKTAVEVLR
jgi:sugar (pentulose or hexulose) kinase